MRQKKKSGFTLIELLVVIAIIGLLASIVLVSLNSARKKARDAKRLTDISQIQTALEMYYDNNGRYPAKTQNECGGTEGYTTSANDFMKPLVDADLLASYPVDPAGLNCNMQYTEDSSYGAGQGYVIFAKFEYFSNPYNHNCTATNEAAGWSCFGSNTAYMDSGS